MSLSLSPDQQKFLRLLAEGFPTQEALCTEIARLSAQLSLPKGTEHFMSDIHGEYEAFCHIMNNCSGVIREKVSQWLGDQLTAAEADELCTLIYYPEAVLRQNRLRGLVTPEWIREQVARLTHLARMLSSKYTRDKVRRAMPEDCAFLLDELLHCQEDEGATPTEQEENRRRYRDVLINALIETDGSDALLEALAALIKRLAVDRLHVVGDIFDRGPRADSIMDILLKHHSVDIEWGNHDILWMGAASGSECCIAGVLRNSLAHHNMDILERGYGIPLRTLSILAEQLYPDLPLDRAMLETVTVILFKLEGQLIRRNPEFQMEDRLLLHRISPDRTFVDVDGAHLPLRQLTWPTLNSSDPYALSPDEQTFISAMRHNFTHSPRLREHVAFLYRRGWMYRAFNGNLLFHGCIPLNEDGTFLMKTLDGIPRGGKALMDYADQQARKAFFVRTPEALDFMWYLWCGSDSPVCGRQVKTFARAYITDESAWDEPRNPYYFWYNREEICEAILSEFGLTDPESRIINGHTPIRVTHGESPLKAGGRLVVIDGGFCRAYQKTTGIAGYTLIANSHCMRLMSHQPFTTLKDARETGRDIHSQSFEFATWPVRKYVRDTDHGRLLEERKNDLLRLLEVQRANGQV